MNCGTEDDECAGLDRDVAHRRQPPVTVVGGRRDPDLRSAAVHPVARQRHPVLPADQPTNARGRGVDYGQVIAGADPVEQPLVLGWHQLAVTRKQA